MKILSTEQIREADAYTIRHEPISDIDLMERAARSMAHWCTKEISRDRRLIFFTGTGNNGGDGYALARLLETEGFETLVFRLDYSPRLSASCKTNLECYSHHHPVHLVKSPEDLPQLRKDDIIFDGIFGSGLSRPVTGVLGDLIEAINRYDNRRIAIDVPSGLFIDKPTPVEGKIFKADTVLSLQFPKRSFMFSENQDYTGEFHIIDIGLHPDFIEKVEVNNYFVLQEEVAKIKRKRKKFSHKGTYGHGLLIAGGYGKYGASVLAARAAIRAGAGLITTHLPSTAVPIMQTAAPEIMLSIDKDEKFFSQLPDLSPYNALAIGPGLGLESKPRKAVLELIQKADFPLIIDADGLNILAGHPAALSQLPPHSILSPHPKEFARLFGETKDSYHRLELLRQKAGELNIYILLKGAYTALATPEGDIFHNSTGNPGMATAGSGDVLTGILLGLRASGYSPVETALLGMYVHGLAGDIAARKQGHESLIAGDIIASLGEAFLQLAR